VTQRGRRIGLWLVVAALIIACGSWAFVWRQAYAPISPPGAGRFAADQVARGAVMAAIGDCAVCHTADDGAPYAGGKPIPTPFGVIVATNITPDVDTGIGRWSEAAFRRAMRDGIARDGSHLYPVLPYPHFTRATDADIAALYAFLMTRQAVAAPRPRNRLPFPLNVRAMLAGWNLLYLRPGPWQPDPSKGSDWNRGAYLVEAVGHCGACHTPHNALGAERGAKALNGGEAEGWSAPSLNDFAASPAHWSIDDLTAYLRTGLSGAHGAASGPMRAVTDALAHVPEADVRAIAVYIASLRPGSAPPPPGPVATPLPAPLDVEVPGNAVFTGACGGCHAPDAPMMRAGAPSLTMSSAVNAPTPRNVVQIILLGLPWQEAGTGPFMPGFAETLSDADIAAVVRYLRARYSTRPAWIGIDAAIQDARRHGGS
jgi:mono/diheme cytochrome c family protein